MKKFAFFITALFLLIASEYYFLTEIFTRRRMPVIAASLVCAVACIYLFLRVFKNAFKPSSR